MKPSDIRKQIASGDTASLYLLEGEDVQSRHELAAEFAGIVDEGLQAFNVESFYANEATTAGARDELIANILSAARTLPMMAPRRVLLVQQAERLLSPRKAKDEEVEPPKEAPGGGKRKRILTPAEELEAYFEAPERSTTLVFVAGDLDPNRRLVKILRKHAISVDTGTIETDDEAAQWIQRRLQADALTIEPTAVSLLLSTTGLTLGRIRSEIDKLALYAAGERTITVRHVRDLVMPQSEPGENFALGKAIWTCNAREALREIAAQIDAGSPAFFILGQIRAAIGSHRKASDASKRAGLDAVLETDIAIKSSAGEEQFLLERLVIELCANLK